MKRKIALIISFMFIISSVLVGHAMADTSSSTKEVGFHSTNIYTKDNILYMEGYIYNVGSSKILGIDSVSLKVTGDNNVLIGEHTYSDPSLKSINLATGQAVKWTFTMDAKAPITGNYSYHGDIYYKHDNPSNLGDDVKIYFNGNKLDFDVQPQIENGRLLVPVRVVFANMGAKLDWNVKTNTLTVTKANTTIIITLNSKVAYVNGNKVMLDAPAKLMNDRTMIPLRFISETFGNKVFWCPSNSVVGIFE